MKKTVKFKKLVPEAELPTYAHDGDIGLDVKCTSVEYDRVNDVYIYNTGLACETGGHMGILGMMKSGIYKKGDCYLTNAVGLIDSDQYRGEIKFIYRSRVPIWLRAMHEAIKSWNSRSWWYRFTHNFNSLYEEFRSIYVECAVSDYAPYAAGDVCGQLVPLTFDQVEIVDTQDLSETERGEGGFGSTSEHKTKTTTRKKSKKSKEKN